jgi:hypothetical protein
MSDMWEADFGYCYPDCEPFQGQVVYVTLMDYDPPTLVFASEQAQDDYDAPEQVGGFMAVVPRNGMTWEDVARYVERLTLVGVPLVDGLVSEVTALIERRSS